MFTLLLRIQVLEPLYDILKLRTRQGIHPLADSALIVQSSVQTHYYQVFPSAPWRIVMRPAN